jgi:hypothetical protein
MRVEKHVELDGDVEVDIGAEDIAAALAGVMGTENEWAIGRCVCNAISALKAVPDQFIVNSKPELRRVAIENLEQQLARWRDRVASSESQATGHESPAEEWDGNIGCIGPDRDNFGNL